MAAISQKVSPDEVLPLLARNVSVQGYQDGKPTEFLVLLRRYMDQARELVVLAGSEGIIRVSSCNEGRPLLAILGYRLREACGPKSAVETSDPDRAFLTIDSGFPLADLEETMRGGKAFTYPYASSQVPVLFAPNDWVVDDKYEKDVKKEDKDHIDPLDSILRDPSIARIYWAMSRIDVETVSALRQSPGVRNLIPFAPVVDFYGSQISIRSGRVAVPGGSSADNAWKELVGARPDAPAEFVTKLLSKDDGWMAMYFDVLSRLSSTRQAYFADPHRLRRFYEALRGSDLSPSPSRPVFRPDPNLLLLATRVQMEPNGQPHLPGGLEVWKSMIGSHKKDDSKISKEWSKRASHLNNSEQVVEAMFGLTRVIGSNGTVQIFLALSEMDRARSADQRLTASTVQLLADKFAKYSQQYAVFIEFPSLNNSAITHFISAAEAVDKLPDHALRSNAMGIFQANVGLWEILARQGEIASAQANDSWQRLIDPFVGVRNSVQLFDAGRASFQELLRAVMDKADLSQDEFIAFLAGPIQTTPDGLQVKQEIASRIRIAMDDQRLLSLDALFGLADGMNLMAQGKPAPENLLAKAQELREFEMPRPFFTTTERSEWAAGLYNTSHATLQMRTDLTKIIKNPGSPSELGAARGQLAPLLRDTLVGLNYAYYEPPAAQTLHNNPLLVRSHDFSGEMTPGSQQAWQVPRVFGRGWTASGGAHLTGSLADLPYVLAQMEQDFTVPENVQALIWDELVPDLVSSAVTPRWWGVTRNEVHAVALYQRVANELLAAASQDEKLRRTVMGILSDRMLSSQFVHVDEALRAGAVKELLPEVTPADKFYLAGEFRRRFPSDQGPQGAAGTELDALSHRYPEEVSLDRLSQDFGVPHPVLEQNYGRELLNVKPFPAFMGFPSRLMAETWDSDNLYWASLADEMGFAPEVLNTLVPQLTHRMVEKIFATDFEDWQAVLRAMSETGEEFRRSGLASTPRADVAPGR
ncbi:MAG: hypothetical protein ABSA57_01485 [Candidatus Acidiferrales bacterium]|jgi:hypothetical protein